LGSERKAPRFPFRKIGGCFLERMGTKKSCTQTPLLQDE
jgi:hypothetical protein